MTYCPGLKSPKLWAGDDATGGTTDGPVGTARFADVKDLDAYSGHLYVADGDRVRKIDLATNIVSTPYVAAGGRPVDCVEVDRTTGRIYIGEALGLASLDPVTYAKTVHLADEWPSPGFGVRGVSLNAAGTAALVATGSSYGRTFRLDTATWGTTWFANTFGTFNAAADVELDETNGLVLVSVRGFSESVYQVDYATGTILDSVVIDGTSGISGGPRRLWLEAPGSLIACGSTTKNLYRLDTLTLDEACRFPQVQPAVWSPYAVAQADGATYVAGGTAIWKLAAGGWKVGSI